MAITLASSDLLKVLDPANAITRGCFSNRRRPWAAGYGIKAAAVGTTYVVGVNHPGTLAATSVRVTLPGAGAAASATVFTYTVPSSTVTLPTDTSVVVGATYANAIMVAYIGGSKTGTLVPRLGKDVANLTDGPFWRVETSTTIETVAGGTTGAFTDWAVDDIIEIIVPAAADIDVLADVVTGVETVITSYDFMFAGTTAKAGIAYLNRIFA